MAANSRMASAVQILCVMAYKGPAPTNSEVIARSLRTNPVVVLGAISLAIWTITLTVAVKYALLVLRAQNDGEGGVFALRAGGNPNCPVNVRMEDLLTPVFGAADMAVERTLRRTTLGSLMRAIG